MDFSFKIVLLLHNVVGFLLCILWVGIVNAVLFLKQLTKKAFVYMFEKSLHYLAI